MENLKQNLEFEAIQEHRRKLEDRRKRILNDQYRLIGIDTNAIEEQISEKNQIRNNEIKEWNNYYNKKGCEDEVCNKTDKKINQMKKKIEEELAYYRIQQKFEDRKEFDLNDPDYKKKSLPARIGDEDPRCTISSAQIFEGEDLDKGYRINIQTQQMKSWLTQQMKEKQIEEEEERKMKKQEQELIIKRDMKTMELMKREEQMKRDLKIKVADFNRKMADKKARMQKQKHEAEIQDNIAEMENWLYGDFMLENPDQAASQWGSHRKLQERYKGEHPSKTIEVLHEQKIQVKEKEEQKKLDEEVERAWEELNKGLQRRIYFQDKDFVRTQRELNKNMVEINKRTGIQLREHEEMMKKLFENVPTEKFYEQFQRTAY